MPDAWKFAGIMLVLFAHSLGWLLLAVMDSR